MSRESEKGLELFTILAGGSVEPCEETSFIFYGNFRN